jgi:sulfoquinovose isomerase
MTDRSDPSTGSTARLLSDFVQEEPARLLAFGRNAVSPEGGFHWLTGEGRIDPTEPRFLYITGRFTHTYALGSVLGLDGATELAEHGVRSLRTVFRHPSGQGWWAALPRGTGCGDDTRNAYATSFVVLAGASGAIAGVPGAQDLLVESLAAVDALFWSEDEGAVTEDAEPDPSFGPGYRGLNSNMHMVEAYLAAYSAGAGTVCRDRAERIARRAVAAAQHCSWRLPEHFTAQWEPLLDHNVRQQGDPFRPYGSTVGHWMEWARLLLHLESAVSEDPTSTDTAWMRSAAVTLFDRAIEEGWEADGREGFVYTVDWDGRPVVRRRLHWVTAEAISAAATLYAVTADARYAAWRDRWVSFVHERFVDAERGSWNHELDPENRPSSLIKKGKADIYHSSQAMLLAGMPDMPVRAGLAAALAEHGTATAAGTPR